MRISPRVTIPEDEIQLQFIRSAGPGGQNVNKVSTGVQLRFDAVNSKVLPDDVRERLIKLAGSRASDQGVIVIEAKRSRKQARNREQARSVLRTLLQKAEKKPRTRIPTRPSKASIERRLNNKKHQSRAKQSRQWKPNTE